MAQKTNVVGNRVTIDDTSYDIKPAGTGRYAVADEFGAALGYITVRGRAVEADDYGVQGAHPLMLIGKLWVASVGAEPVVAKPSVMVCRIATSDSPAEADVERAKAYAAHLKQQPGAKAAFVTHDAATGKMLGISVWTARDKMVSATEKPGPDGSSDPSSATIVITQLARDF